MCGIPVLEGLIWGKNTDKEGVAGGRVNAKAFSLPLILALETTLHAFQAFWSSARQTPVVRLSIENCRRKSLREHYNPQKGEVCANWNEYDICCF